MKGETAPDFDDLAWERHERRQWLEAAQSFDPTASLAEEFIVRLVGRDATGPGFRLDWQGLLKPLQEALSSDAGGGLLELSSMSKGSTVLHFRAATRVPVERLSGDFGGPVHETPLAAPLREFIDVVNTAENEEDLRGWADSPVLEGLEKVSDELHKLALEAEFRFYARGGDVRAARLSERGMGYMRSLEELEDFTRPEPISGRVTELRASGHAKVKAGSNRNSTAFDVEIEPEALSGMRLVLGQNVHWLVQAVENKDRLGRQRALKFRFDRDLGASEQVRMDDFTWGTEAE